LNPNYRTALADRFSAADNRASGHTRRRTV